ncbi:helix-turn-helix domain-containing protein [Streptomyces nogalater]
MLVGALRQLPGTASAAQVATAAVRAGLSFNEADRALAGKDILPWDRMRSLVEQLGGHSEDLHFCGRCPCRPAAHRRICRGGGGPSGGGAAGILLAAGQPPLDEVASLTGVSADRLEAILLGRCVPAWDTIAALATALRTDPSLLRNLWDGVRCTFSASPHHFPRGGFLLG